MKFDVDEDGCLSFDHEGYDGTGTGGNGYQPCGCHIEPNRDEDTISLLKEQMEAVKFDLYWYKENIKGIMEDEDNYYLLKSQIIAMEMLLQRLGGTEDYE